MVNLMSPPWQLLHQETGSIHLLKNIWLNALILFVSNGQLLDLFWHEENRHQLLQNIHNSYHLTATEQQHGRSLISSNSIQRARQTPLTFSGKLQIRELYTYTEPKGEKMLEIVIQWLGFAYKIEEIKLFCLWSHQLFNHSCILQCVMLAVEI